MIVWLIWALPVLAAIAIAARPAPPGPWLDRLLHFFGVGALDSRRAAIAILAIVAIAGWATDAVLALTTGLDVPWRQLDGLAIGAVVALAALLFACWLDPRPVASDAPATSEPGEPSAKTPAPERGDEAC